jgi:protein ImuB
VAREEAGDLFSRGRRGAAGAAAQFVECLRARLGADAVHGIRLVPEHRPEAAWKAGDILPFPVPLAQHVREAKTGKGGMSPVLVPRPLWLLAEPRLLDGLDWPHYEGRLEIEDGPERIESGWWDGRDVRRDYYVARTASGVRLWVFCERKAKGRWFMHGVFG